MPRPDPLEPSAPPQARAYAAAGDDPVLAARAGLAAFALYAATTSAYVLNEDVAEFQALGAGGGLAHAGYPLHTLALEAFRHLPFSTPAFRANLVSGVAAAVAVGLAVRAARRLGAGRVASLAAALALALSQTLWHEATRAEIYAFTLPLAAGAFLALDAARRGGRPRAWLACGLLTGLALASHLSSLGIATLAAAVALERLARRRLSASAAAAGAAGLALGLAPLALLVLRDVPDHPLNYLAYTFDAWSPLHVPWAPDLAARARRVALLLSGRQFLEGGWFQPFMDTPLRLRLLALHVGLNDLPLLGTALAALGAAAGLARRGTTHALLVAWIAATLGWLSFGAYPNVLASFFLPGLWALAVLAACGTAWLARSSRAAGLGAAVLLVALPLARLSLPAPPGPLAARPLVAAAWRAWPADWSPFRHDRSWEDFGRAALAVPAPGATVLACWDEGTTLLYLRHAAGVRTDVDVRLTCDARGRVEAAIERAARADREVYATLAPPRLPRPERWVEAGRWARGALWRYRR